MISKTKHIVNGLIVTKSLGKPLYQVPKTITQDFFDTLKKTAYNKNDFKDIFINKLREEGQTDINLNFVIDIFKKAGLISEQALPVIEKEPLAAIYEIQKAFLKKGFFVQSLIKKLNPKNQINPNAKINLIHPNTKSIKLKSKKIPQNTKIITTRNNYLTLLNRINQPDDFATYFKILTPFIKLSESKIKGILEYLEKKGISYSDKCFIDEKMLLDRIHKAVEEKKIKPEEVLRLFTYNKKTPIPISDSFSARKVLTSKDSDDEIIKKFLSFPNVQRNIVSITKYMEKATNTEPGTLGFNQLLIKFKKDIDNHTSPFLQILRR